jgi:hypothetical protein
MMRRRMTMSKWDPHYLKPFEERTLLGKNTKIGKSDIEKLMDLIRDSKKEKTDGD